MKFRKLRLAGFKSFVEPAELLIEPGLTGVVGPNGCGKSNLLEAMRWVMGEGSAKSLRGGGMEDVIFAGTAQRPPRDFAEVSLLCETADGDHEVVRRIERGAGSAYRLNGRDVRQRDVALLFADASTGAHSPALVSQGRIAAVIAAKPTERRQMLEEAAGIAGLHVRRREAESRLKATEANLDRLDQLLAEMETRANALRRQARAAERYRTLSAEIALAEGRALFARWRQAATVAEQAQAAARAAEEEVLRLAEAQRAAAALAGAAVRELSTARTEAEAAREAAAEARHVLEKLRGEAGGVRRRSEEVARQRDELARDRGREDQLAVDAAAALTALDAEDKALTAALAASERERAAAEAALAEAERAMRAAEVTHAQAVAALAAEEAEARVATAALSAARARHARAEAEQRRLEAEAPPPGTRERLDGALAEARGQVARHVNALDCATHGQGEAERARDAAAARLAGAEREQALAAAALARLESEAKALAASLARDAGDRALASLTVAAGYEHALAAALGDDLEAPIGVAGQRGWRGAPVEPDDPSLPPGVEPLARFVSDGDALARRLAQVGVAEHDEGQPLRVGQRLVTVAGAMRRWDGFAAQQGGAAAAERLIRANRLREAEAALPAARAEAQGARDAHAAAVTAQRDAREAAERARRVVGEAEMALRASRRGEDAATAALDRHAAVMESLRGRTERASAEHAEASAALAQASDAAAALPDGGAAKAEVAALALGVEQARRRHGDERARLAALADAIGRDGRRQQAARAEAKGWRSRAGDAARRIEEMARRLLTAETELQALEARMPQLTAGIERAHATSAEAEAQATRTRAAEAAREAALREAEARATQAAEVLANARERRATLVSTAEHNAERRAELSRAAGDRFSCPAATLPDRLGFDGATVGEADEEVRRHERLTADRERLGPVNLVAESELHELEETRAANAAEREELGQSVNRLRGSIGSLNREGRQRLVAAFEAVDGHFRRLFTTLFAGGEAHLALIDAEDPLEAGLEIMAQPPGKRLGSLGLLSGGEQALTAVALIFALFLTSPAPICVLDEVDAPLDDANIERFCDLLIRMTQETETRYLVVTHNAVTMSRMDRLFGVTMVERGVSRLVSVDLGQADRLLAAE